MDGKKIGNNLIVKLSFDFALLIIVLAEELELKRKFVIGNQILKSGTSIGANIWEAQNAESKADFIHKMKIAAKECEETKYWLLLYEGSENYPSNNNLLEKIERSSLQLSGIINYHIITFTNHHIITLSH